MDIFILDWGFNVIKCVYLFIFDYRGLRDYSMFLTLWHETMFSWSLLLFLFPGRRRKWGQQRAGQSDVSVLRQRHADAEDAEWRHVEVRLRCESVVD